MRDDMTNTQPKGIPLRNVVMKIDGITVAVLVEHDCLQGKDFDELCTALLLTIANQTGKAVSKEVTTA